MGAAESTEPEPKEPPAKAKLLGGQKRRLILLGLPLGLAALGAFLWFSGILPGMLGLRSAKNTAAAGRPDTLAERAYLDMPEIIANLNVSSHRESFVKLKARLELAKPSDQAKVAAVMPQLLDLFNTYLREMRPEELRGAAGTYRLREELIARANIVAAPARVTDVFFTEMLIQ